MTSKSLNRPAKINPETGIILPQFYLPGAERAYLLDLPGTEMAHLLDLTGTERAYLWDLPGAERGYLLDLQGAEGVYPFESARG